MKIKTLIKISDWITAIRYLAASLGPLGAGIGAVYHALYGDLKTPHQYGLYMNMGSIAIIVGLLIGIFVIPRFIYFIRNQ